MYDLTVLETEFGAPEPDHPGPMPTCAAPGDGVTGGYGLRLDSLLRALSGRYRDCLYGTHSYESDSEADMAVLDAMVARHFTDSEVWQTLEGSPLYARRVEKKGEKHARDLYADEIAKARATVRPFDRDPGEERPRRANPRAADANDPPDDPDLPEIVITDEHLHKLSEAAWAALLQANDPPLLFQHGGSIAQVKQDEEGRHLIKDLSIAAVRGILDRSARWMRQKKDELVPARPPKDVIEDMIALDKPLPIIRGIVGTPVFTADGRLATEPGFQPSTGLFYVPVGKAVPPISERPTPSDIALCKSLLFDEWLPDFPFVDQASRATVIGAALTPMCREAIQGPTPLTALDAPSPGTGKGLLAETMGIVISGASPAVMNDARQEEEIRKRITSVLREGHSIVLIDNVKRRLVSATLAALLTSTVWADRLLGGNEMARVQNRSLWVATGNNLDFDREIARRTVWSRLDSRVDRPWERQGFRHNPLAPWVHAHRHELVWALLTLIQHWQVAGRPAWKGLPLGSFESWCDVVGGILEAAEIDGFLGNREQLYQQADTETEDWRAFVLAWWEAFGPRPVKATELLAMTQRDQLLLSLFATARDVATERSLVTRLGTALAARRDRRFGQFFIRHLGHDGHAKGALYRLEAASGGEEDAEPVDIAGQGSAEVPHGSGPDLDTNAEPAERAEPKTHAGTEMTFEPDHAVPDTDFVASPNEVPQVPQVPQTDSKTPPGPAEPMAESGGKVPQQVPQPSLLAWSEEVR